MPPYKKRGSWKLNEARRRNQPMRSCRRVTEVSNAGKVQRVCPDRRMENKTLSLPKELMFNILLLLPADVLYNIMRYMCSQWYKIIRDPVFIKAHLLRANAGLFIQHNRCSHDGYYADTSTGDVTVERINFKFPGEVWGSCDGLVLFSDPKDRKILHLVNPITKQQFTLPPFKQYYSGSHFMLGRACSTGEYKVVGTYVCMEYKLYHCLIVTVGKDVAWREIDLQPISLNRQTMLMQRPLSAGGFIFWVVDCRDNFLTLDVEAEVVRDFPVPKPCRIGWATSYKEKGNSLSCLFWKSKTLLYGVLVLADPRRGKWENLYKFDLEGKRHVIRSFIYKYYDSPPRFLYLRPVAWVNNGEVVVFTTYSLAGVSYVAHNVETGETSLFDMCKEKGAPFWLVHVNSLVKPY